MRLLLSLLVLPALAVAAPVPKALKKATDDRLILGRWALVSVDTGNGPEPPAEAVRKHEFEFREDGTYDFRDNGVVHGTSTYSIDASSNPKTLDRGWAESAKSKSFELYELDGDTLTTSSTNGWNEPRPEGFKAVRNKAHVYVYTRVK